MDVKVCEYICIIFFIYDKIIFWMRGRKINVIIISMYFLW